MHIGDSPSRPRERRGSEWWVQGGEGQSPPQLFEPCRSGGRALDGAECCGVRDNPEMSRVSAPWSASAKSRKRGAACGDERAGAGKLLCCTLSGASLRSIDATAYAAR